MKPIAILTLGVVGGAGAFGLLSWVQPSAAHTRTALTAQRAVVREEASNTQANTAELQAQLRQLALEVGALRQQGLAAAATLPTPVEPESAPPTPVPSPEAKAQAQQEHSERIADVEAAFRGEAQDPMWSRPTEGSIRDAVTGAKLTQGRLQEVQCRSSTCRVEIALQDPVTFSREMPNLISQLPTQLHGSAMDFVDDPRGGHTGILYLFR